MAPRPIPPTMPLALLPGLINSSPVLRLTRIGIRTRRRRQFLTSFPAPARCTRSCSTDQLLTDRPQDRAFKKLVIPSESEESGPHLGRFLAAPGMTSLQYSRWHHCGEVARRAEPCCSICSKALLRSTPQRYPPISPSSRTTRWHGMATAIRFEAHARATARAAFG